MPNEKSEKKTGKLKTVFKKIKETFTGKNYDEIYRNEKAIPATPQTTPLADESKGSSPDGLKTMRLAQLLCNAAGIGDIDWMKRLIKNGADVNAKNKWRGGDYETALMQAAMTGQIKACRFLIENGADVNATKDNDGWTAVMIAALMGNTDTVKYLLSMGADPFLKSKIGQTAYDIVYTHANEIRGILKFYMFMWETGMWEKMKLLDEKYSISLAVSNCEPEKIKEAFENM